MVAALCILVLCAVFVLDTRLLRNLFYATALPVSLLALPHLGPRDIMASGIARLTLIYVAYLLVAALWSANLDLQGLADLLRVEILVLVFFATVMLLALRDAQFEERLFRGYALTASASLLVLMAAIAAGLFPLTGRLSGFGITDHPIIGATLYGVALLICAFALLPRAEGWQWRLLWLAIACLCAAAMLFSGSRGPLLALAVALVTGFALAERHIAITMIGLIAAGLMVGLASDVGPLVTLFTRDQSGHFAIWHEALENIAAQPWFGYGTLVDFGFESKHGPSRSAHNLFLANQLYGGLPATLLLLALLLLALRQAWQALRQGRPVYLVLLVFGLTASLFDSRTLLQNLGREWVSLWLPIALLAARELRGNIEPPSQSLRE